MERRASSTVPSPSSSRREHLSAGALWTGEDARLSTELHMFSSLLQFFGHILGPLLGTVQHAQNPHGVASDAISGDVGRAVNNQFPRSFDPAWSAALRETR